MRWSLLVVLAACGVDPNAPIDPPSSTSNDAGRTDGTGGGSTSGGDDAGFEPDASIELDAGADDAGAIVADAGVTRDGGTARDAGVTTPDAGQVVNWPDPGTMTSPARVYTADGRSFVIDQIGDALGHALTGSTTRHVIVYLHGRSCGGGGEPMKSLGDAVPELERDYRAKVLMFSWPGSSTGCPIGFPEAEARASGPAFTHAMHKLAWSLSTTPRPGLTLTLIPHSMGNLVVEEALAGATQPWPPRLFATVMVQSSASASSGHASWLSRLSFSPAVYVSVNSGDSVLTAAGVGRSTRLGKSVSGSTLTSVAAYVDFSASNVNHAYYLHGGQKGRGMAEFYDSVMAGRPFNFATSTHISRRDMRNGAVVYIFDGN